MRSSLSYFGKKKQKFFGNTFLNFCKKFFLKKILEIKLGSFFPIVISGIFCLEFFFRKVYSGKFFPKSFSRKVFSRKFSSGKFFPGSFSGKFFSKKFFAESFFQKFSSGIFLPKSFWKINSERFFFTILSDFLGIFRQYKSLDLF